MTQLTAAGALDRPHEPSKTVIIKQQISSRCAAADSQFSCGPPANLLEMRCAHFHYSVIPGSAPTCPASGFVVCHELDGIIFASKSEIATASAARLQVTNERSTLINPVTTAN